MGRSRNGPGELRGSRHRGILSQAREQYAKADREAALETIKPILDSRHVGPEAQLLYAGILVDNRRSGEGSTFWFVLPITNTNDPNSEPGEQASPEHGAREQVAR